MFRAVLGLKSTDLLFSDIIGSGLGGKVTGWVVPCTSNVARFSHCACRSSSPILLTSESRWPGIGGMSLFILGGVSATEAALERRLRCIRFENRLPFNLPLFIVFDLFGMTGLRIGASCFSWEFTPAELKDGAVRSSCEYVVDRIILTEGTGGSRSAPSSWLRYVFSVDWPYRSSTPLDSEILDLDFRLRRLRNGIF